MPSVDLVEIGAGGGSLARIDELGLLKVGPESAGADPGPACYGRGGTRAAVTDADLALGMLDAGYFLGGDMPLDLAANDAALRSIADGLGLPVSDTAAGIHELVNQNMAAAAACTPSSRARICAASRCSRSAAPGRSTRAVSPSCSTRRA